MVLQHDSTNGIERGTKSGMVVDVCNSSTGENQEFNTSWARVAHTCNSTQEAEIRRIMVRSQPGQIVCETITMPPWTI
jgi:hypothetical protein